MSLDPRTPIIVGVGEVSERLGEADYSAASPIRSETSPTPTMTGVLSSIYGA